jgi:rRNA maturation RNase YbeY
MLSIKIFELNHVFWFKNRKQLKVFLPIMCAAEGFSVKSIHIILCGDDYLLEINKQHLQHDFYTDIITFDLSDSNDLISGELYISTDRVIDNASQLNTNKIKEIHRVIFHGCLHLCGFGDKTDDEITIMRQKEDYYLDQYFSTYYNVPRGTL